MIKVTDLHGVEYLLNPDQIEKVEHNPDTQIALLNGHRYYVRETIEEIAAQIIEYRAEIRARAAQLTVTESGV